MQMTDWEIQTRKRRKMIKAIIYLLVSVIVIAVIASLSSCHRPPVVARNDSTEKVIIRETVYDTTYLIDSDSSWVQYLIECQGEKARLVQMVAMKPGENVRPPEVVIRDRYLTAKCKVDSFAVYQSMKVRDTTRITSVSSVVVKQENYLTGWQWFQVWAFRIMAGLIIVYLILIAVRKYVKPL
jgi:hypothetical protein